MAADTIQPEGEALLEPHRVRRKLAATDRPYVTLKAAITLDGKIATRTGASQWITGEAARALAHRLRAAHDGVLVGAGTVVADDPRLTARLPDSAARPARIVLDSTARTPPTARWLAADGAARFLVIGGGAPEGRVATLREAGAEVLACPSPRPDAAEFLPLLRARGIATLLVEGGGQVHANVIARREADELVLFVAGKVFGGSEAPGWCAAIGVDSLEQAPRVAMADPCRIGDDLLIRGTFHWDA